MLVYLGENVVVFSNSVVRSIGTCCFIVCVLMFWVLLLPLLKFCRFWLLKVKVVSSCFKFGHCHYLSIICLKDGCLLFARED